MRNLWIVVFLLIAGCATGPAYYVAVSSLANAQLTSGRTYDLWPVNEGIQPSDLQFQEYAAYIDRALTAKGFKRAAPAVAPDVLVFVGYGIGDPERQMGSYSLPMYGQTGVSAATTTGTVNSYGNTASYSATTTYTPRYGITGFSTQTYTYTTFTRFVVLDAVFLDLKKEPKDWAPAFRTNIVSTGSSGDLRRVSPIMIAAAVSDIGGNTGRAKSVELYEDDVRVRYILGEPGAELKQ